MSDDLVSRLRAISCRAGCNSHAMCACVIAEEAAEAIDRLTQKRDDELDWRVESQEANVLLTRQLEERANTIAKLMTAFISIELSAENLERRCAKLGHNDLVYAAQDIAITARKALEDKGP